MSEGHPLLSALEDAARGRFPPVDGGVTFVPPARSGVEAIVAFTGHAFIMTRLTESELVDLGADGFGGALHPAVQMQMARGGEIGVNDVTTVWLTGEGSLDDGEVAEVLATADHDEHARVRHALAIRTDVAVYAGLHGLITMGTGLAGRQEMSIEVWNPGDGRGSALIRAARHLADPLRPLFAAVAPGNARSLRAFLAEGFVPIASEVVIVPDR